MPFRNRNPEQVDSLAFIDVFEQCAGLYRDRRDGFRLLHVTAPVVHEIDCARAWIISEREVNPPDRSQDIGQHPMSLRITGNIVEQNCGIAGLPLIKIDNTAEVPKDDIKLTDKESILSIHLLKSSVTMSPP